MDTNLTLSELRLLRTVSRSLDDLLEEAVKNRENLDQTFRRIFPPLCALTGARAVALTTMDEEMVVRTFHYGNGSTVFPGAQLSRGHWGVRRLEDGHTLVSQALDLVGTPVGAIGLLFDGDRTAEAAELARLLEAVAEELDTVLASVQVAAEKQQLLVSVNHCLSNRVFEVGMDGAVRALCERVRLPGFLLLYRDAVESLALHYRVYRYGQLESASNARPDPRLEAVVNKHGANLVAPNDRTLRELFGDQRAVETLLISGMGDAAALGKILVWSGGEGFSAYTMDLLRLLASTLSQRLLDYNRERTHLAQFFSPAAIDQLLQDPDYERKFLTARAEEIGILFADINGFTRICEQVLVRPERIGKFVDDWSAEAVRILHHHGGVFDKMVGDCVIGLFGPPFFSDSRASRAGTALRAALQIQRFTNETMSAHPEISRLSELLSLPGLGVAVGVNLALSYCGLFGPNRNYTSFSTGMNQTARLQALGGFRETLVMKSIWEALGDPELLQLDFGELQETAVKNVEKPLQYFRLAEVSLSSPAGAAQATSRR